MVDKEDFGDEPVLWLPAHSDRPVVEVSELVRHYGRPQLETVASMFSSTLLTLVVVPVFYVALDDFVQWLRRAPRALWRRIRTAQPATP